MTDFVTVTTTTDSAEEAQRLSAAVVEARLAACGQQSSPVTSTYWWQGRVESATEYRIDFKTRAALAEPLVAFLRERHSYQLPEIIVAPITGGNPAYLEWIETETETGVVGT